MTKTNDDIEMITIRTATNFGYQLANDFGMKLEDDNILPSQWPIKLPLTYTQVTKLPEINKNNKIAHKVVEAARAMWKDLRETAIEIEKDMKLHPEYYEMLEMSIDASIEKSVWRELSIELEQIAGKIFMTVLDSEDSAKDH